MGGASPQDRARIAESPGALAQRPSRQPVAISQANSSVYADQIYLTRHSMVLEAVVEQEDLGSEERTRAQAEGRPVATRQYGHAWESTGQSTRGPLEGLEDDDFRDGLAEAINNLPERERLVISLYYDEELNLREIGEVLGVSESRVCQIHSQATCRLRSRLREWRAAD